MVIVIVIVVAVECKERKGVILDIATQ